MKQVVIFIHGAGQGAYEEDELLANSLRKALGSGFEVRYPRMPTDDTGGYADWTRPIDRELAHLDEAVVLVGHIVQEVEGGGHHFANDLADVAKDIGSVAHVAGRPGRARGAPSSPSSGG